MLSRRPGIYLGRWTPLEAFTQLERDGREALLPQLLDAVGVSVLSVLACSTTLATSIHTAAQPDFCFGWGTTMV